MPQGMYNHTRLVLMQSWLGSNTVDGIKWLRNTEEKGNVTGLGRGKDGLYCLIDKVRNHHGNMLLRRSMSVRDFLD